PMHYRPPSPPQSTQRRILIFSSHPHYPCASPTPPICSSPRTHTGHALWFSCSTWKLWFFIGRPYGMLFHSARTSSMGYRIDQIAASVAPPKLISFSPGCSFHTRSAKLNGIQSPLSIPNRKLSGNFSPV